MKGEVKLAGAKNAATKLLVASILSEEPSVLENFPIIGDTAITAGLCEELGSEILKDGNTVSIKTPVIKNTRVGLLTRRNRIPVLALGPLLARAGRAEVPVVGGDKIGARPVDIHLEALKKLGAEVTISGASYEAKAPEGLRGAEITFRFPSVGATENTLLASVLAKGKTVMRNAALEPEIMDLIKFLQKMGAIIELGANRTIYVEGVSRLRGAKHSILPDRNEAVSFACLAVVTGGDIFVKDAVQEHLITFLNTLRRIGGDYEVVNGGVRFWRAGKLTPTSIETDTHPGFMTDWQQPLAILLTQAEGVSKIHETVYEDRFSYTKDLNLMGADIIVTTECLGSLPCRFSGKFPHSATISGPTPLKGMKLEVPDLRAGMAHLTAALIAEGESEISGVEEIDRGYERIDERLRYLGADIKRIDD
ncbi:MAG: UDP-N-acetylglucosamine 1-carboxyvinyltransferase [Candidatus Jorgensenbacteria bacterium GW2011_GWC1_48_8]|uniref:UDP-N-acetylglucosamine 1-carboxyvinyltransferase n=1 Tax=Candidatus Jorgensenbacteria bacterium GW2011_GWC1_48_8 TaxID=1618666 RepID=A0A0G1UYH6_9BACT|nr:MAG: UDP-N-acetylglucosamine 1-carboxyvinyltransferase [Candidatus Jorgensenbacteria bacterium GW2011_GWC1_48_8]